MAGVNLIKPCQNDQAFWAKWPKKFREAKRYGVQNVGDHDDDDDDDDVLVKKTVIFYCLSTNKN